MPDISITTDIMVGFPTESEERFLSTVKVCVTLVVLLPALSLCRARAV